MLTNPLLAPLLGLVGIIIGAVANNLLTRAREDRKFTREKKLEAYLDLLAIKSRIRDLASAPYLTADRRATKTAVAQIMEEQETLALRVRLFGSAFVRTHMTELFFLVELWSQGKELTPDHGPGDFNETILKLADDLQRAVELDLGVAPGLRGRRYWQFRGRFRDVRRPSMLRRHDRRNSTTHAE